MGLVLWIDKNDVATGLIEQVFKSRNLSFYSLKNVSDFSYLINDLRPEVIVLDCDTALDDLETFKLQYETSELMRSTSFILINKRPGFEFILKKMGSLHRPLDPFKIPEQLKNILNELN